MKTGFCCFLVMAGLLSGIATVRSDTGDENAVENDVDLFADVEDFESYEEFESIVVGSEIPGAALSPIRARSSVTRDDMDIRRPGSAPDAVRYEPGVFVQQTAHSQGSAYLRGVTGQQTLLLFDGIRLNNSTYRQGPNQYFFTLDSATIDRIEVMRGGGSTRFGSDAMGGVLLVRPLEPVWNPVVEGRPFAWDPEMTLSMATADRSYGGRMASQLTLLDSVAVYGGVGYRDVDQLRSGGPIRGVQTEEAPLVPRFAPDGRTQLGTGFDEWTADFVLRYRKTRTREWKLALYTYRQMDAPRTDQCPAAHAPFDHCLMYDEQFRNLVYVAHEGEYRNPLFRGLRTTLSFQQQHERRSLHRPGAYVRDTGIDDVYTLGVTVTGYTPRIELGSQFAYQFEYGVDTYADRLRSDAWTTFTDIGYTVERSRGQYLNQSSYLYGGAFTEATMNWTRWITGRVGGRFSWIGADAPGDPESGTSPVHRRWFPGVWNIGMELAPQRPVSLILNVDRSFRAPNLDDLTSRQQTGPGFQFENAKLDAERSMTVEAGLRTSGVIRAELWGFLSFIEDAIVRSPHDVQDCPPGTPQCQTSWNRFQLVNADSRSQIRGVEGVLQTLLPWGFDARSTITWTFGEDGDGHPISRIPPLNGTMELLWRHSIGLSSGAALRWAGPQTRLALADVADERIPTGGTPGFAVLDIRLGYRATSDLRATLILENLLGTAYRYHGSSVNGAGRGIRFVVDIGPVWRR